MKIKFFCLTVFIILICSCSRTSGSAADYSEGINENDINEVIEVIIEPEHYSVTFVAAGDNLFHDSIIRSSYVNGIYDFTPIYTEIKTFTENADLAFINQETVMAGTRYGYTGYPLFNTPQSLAGTLADTGFDIVNLANNHAMDMGRDGLYATLDLLDAIEELTVIGARKEGESARIITKNNITFGFLAYTHSLNGIPLPRDNPNLVSMINREKMSEEISALRGLCDFLIVSVHWGAEYLLQPDRSQTDLAYFLAEQNVDLIIGHHPHVLQRVETIILPDGRKTLCYYSLGNFVSTQRERERIIGGMLYLTFNKTEYPLTEYPLIDNSEEDTFPRAAGWGLRPELSISEIGLIPVVTHYDRGFNNTKIYPLYSYTEELLDNHGLKPFDRTLTMDFFYQVMDRLNTTIYLNNPFENKFND